MIRSELETAFAHLQAGRLADADAACRDLVRRRPDRADPSHLLGLINGIGLAYHAQLRLDEAIACYRQALVIDPSRAEIHCNLGRAFNSQGDSAAAIECYRRAIELRPDLAEAHNNLGNVLLAQDKVQEAIECFERALCIRPSLAETHGNLASAWLRLGHFDDAVTACQRALSIRPDYAAAYNHLGTAYLFGGMADEAVAAFQRALDCKPDYAEAHSMKAFAMLAAPGRTPDEIFAVHRAFADRFERPVRSTWPIHPNSPDPERRLKIGYVSPNFYRHSVAAFMEPILAHHDKAAVEVYCYYNHSRIDDATERLRSYADHWLSCKGWSDAGLAGRIQADGIDILVDLAGHTRDGRMLTFARKPAPVQVSYLGYPATTGLTAIDYRLTHADLDPPGSEAWHSERLICLPHTAWCYRPPDDAFEPDVRSPAAGITFGCLNTFSKVTTEAIDLWADILQAVPGSRLAMTYVPEGSPRDTLYRHFAAKGIGSDRLRVHYYLSRDEFRAFQRGIDIALDTFPYNGTTTTCEALWLGIPVVTLEGETSVVRSGRTLLRLLGLSELIARDRVDYRRIAVRLAERPDYLKGGLRVRMASSPLRDDIGMARDIEAAYRSMWRSWCESRTAIA